jgi:DNA-binding MarR family transcriptional regulator
MTDAGPSGSLCGVPLGPPGGQAVGFLLSQLGLVVARQFREAIAVTGLDPREFALLGAIASQDGSTQNTVSEQLGIPASTLVNLLDHLEGAGLVERKTHPQDRRSRTLHTTDAGRILLGQAIGIAMTYEANLCGGLSEAERLELLELLGRVAARLEIEPGVHPGMSIDHDLPGFSGDRAP